MCTNQNLPRKLKLGDICMACEETPEFLSFPQHHPGHVELCAAAEP
jgi:type VI protein secretion system component VasA